MKVYKLSDRIKIKINEIIITVSPLSFFQKTEIQSLMLEAAKGDLEKGMEGARLAIKYAVKDIEGVSNPDGSKYKLSKDDEVLSDSAAEELLNCEMANEIATTCLAFLSSVPTKIIDQTTGKPLEGIEVLVPKPKAQKKKK